MSTLRIRLLGGFELCCGDELLPPPATLKARFFLASTGNGQARWRGQVQHVQSGERAAFADEGALMSFIRRWVQTPEGEVLQRE